jgi:hypothetical protein
MPAKGCLYVTLHDWHEVMAQFTAADGACVGMTAHKK